MEQSLIDRLRRSEHTGERRCWPCTVVNAVLLTIAVVALRRRSRALAIPAALLGAGAIWLRGYLVPGTPRWAPELVAALPVPYDPFDHGDGYAPDPSASGVASGSAPAAATATAGDGVATVETESGETEPTGVAGDGDDRPAPDAPDSLSAEPDPEALLDRLAAAGVLATDGEDLVLDAGFEADWHDRMAELAALDTEALSRVTFEAAHAADHEVYEDDHGEWIILDDGRGGVKGRTWLPRPVAIAEAAAVETLEGRVEDRDTRLAAAGPLRMFLETCPDCGDDLGFTTSQECCGGGTDPRSEPDDVLACPSCRVRLYTFPR
jgi:hypothetical protein